MGKAWVPLVIAASLVCHVSAAPQQPTETEKTARAVLTEAAMTLDGALDEPAWRTAPIVTQFVQRDPSEGEPATEQTEVRIVYTKKSVFFAIRCFDSEPSQVLATELRRDNDLGNDDSISILLDTLHDKRSGYLFRINPLGTQYDALVTDEGRVTDANWNESWNSRAHVDASGWVAEIEIPFRVLRLSGDLEQNWGVDFERIIRRKSEFTYWSNFRRGFDFTKVSQAGSLAGVHDVDAGPRVRVKPFARSSFTQPDGRRSSAFGLEDVKVRISSDFTADLTANTDFAEAEVDAQVLNLTRFPVYFPETREFFVEGAGLFDYGPGGGGSSEFRLFFSRAIGLSPDRTVIPILGGAKVTGKTQGWTVGLLDVQTDRLGRTPGRNFAVARVKKDIFARSNIGAIVTNRSSTAPGDPYNRGFGLDGNFTFFEHLTINTYLASTFTPGRPGHNWAGRSRSYWDSDLFLANVELGAIERNVNPEMGWLPRRDIKKSKFQFDWKPRPASRIIRQWFVRSNMDYVMSMSGTMETRTQDLTLESLLHSGDRFLLKYSHLFDLIRNAFDIQGGARVPPGRYTWDALQARFTSSPNRKLAGALSVRRQWGFYGGDNTEISSGPLWRVNPNISVGPAYQLNLVSLPGAAFTSHLINSQFNVALSNRWLTATTVQHNNVAHLTAVNFRLNYIYRPGDDLFLIYNDITTLPDGSLPRSKNRSVVVKLTRSWDF